MTKTEQSMKTARRIAPGWLRAGRPAVQRQMDLRDPIRTGPLGDMHAAMRDLRLSALDVLALIDSGDLVGFDISAKAAGQEGTATRRVMAMAMAITGNLSLLCVSAPLR